MQQIPYESRAETKKIQRWQNGCQECRFCLAMLVLHNAIAWASEQTASRFLHPPHLLE